MNAATLKPEKQSTMNTHNTADKKAQRRHQWETAGFLAIVVLGIIAALTLRFWAFS